MPITWFTYDFGYSWPFTTGHLLVCAAGVAALALALWRGWNVWITALAGAAAVWGLAGAYVMHHAVQINEPMQLVAPSFAASGSGRVVDLGAGSGRATIGLLQARPAVRVTAVDIYEGYFGIDGNTPERLRRNAALAGVADRVDVQKGDMRSLPFPDATFDAAMSVAAIDHLPWAGVEQALHEAGRVVKPGGQLLIVSLNPDAWIRVAIPASIHGGYWGHSQNQQRWRTALDRAGFEITESGTRPAMVYFLARSRQAVSHSNARPSAWRPA